MTDRELPELPSDEELGIDGLDEEELLRELEEGEPPGEEPSDTAAGPPPPPGPGRRPAPTHPGRGPRGTWTVGLATLAVLVLGVWATSENRALPSTVPANVPDSVFSSGRAMAQLVEMARAPRPVGSPEHTRVREVIVERLEDLGLETRLHTSASLRRSGQTVRAVTLRNVLARIPGTNPTGAIVLMAHYDAVPLSAGAGDDGTGVVTVLEVARALRAGPPLENDVLLLITDAEELGLLGARAFVEEHPWMDDVSVVLNVEMRGGGGPSHMFETGAENGWVVRAMRAADPRPLAASLSVEVYRRLPNDTDFTPFREAGIQGLNFAGIGRPWVYHQPTDVPVNIQEETLQHHGVRVLAITRELGGRDLSSVHAPDLVYATLPLVGILAYPLGWAIPLSAGLLLLWAGVAVLTVTRGGRWLGLLAGLGLSVAAGLAAWALGRILLWWLPRFHPEFGALTPAFYGEGWYVLGLAAGVLALTTVLLGWARRRFSPAALGAGALFLPVLAALGLAAGAPLTALVLQGPALAGVLAVAVLALGGGARSDGRPGFRARIAALGLALIALAFLVPVVEGLWIAMSFRMAPALGVLLVAVFVCILPALDGLGEPNRGWAPAAAAAGAVLLVGAGVVQAGPSPERPVHSTLLYALDREEGEALWATRDDPGRAWAEDRAGPFAEERVLDPFLLPFSYRTAPAPTADIPPPRIRFEGTVPGTTSRTVRLSVISDAGAEIVSVLLPEEVEGRLVGLNGAELPLGPPGTPGARRPVTRITHQGVPHGVLSVDVEVPEAADRIALTVVEEHLRAEEHLGAAPFRRPPHLMPNPGTRSDRALIRTPVVVPLNASPPDLPGAPGG